METTKKYNGKNKLLIQGCLVDMMEQVKMDEKAHRYTRVSDGKFVAGVSSISGLLPKEYLVAWGAKECVKALGYFDRVEGESNEEGMKALAEQLAKIKAIEEPLEYLHLLHDSKGAHARKSKDARDIGTEGHAWCEEYVKAMIRGKKVPAIPQGELERPLKAFVAWDEETTKEWIASEARVYSEEHEFAGTLDGLRISKEEKLEVVDFKFANHISEEYHLQTAGYAIPFEKYGIKINGRVIVRMPKTEYLLKWDEKKRLYVRVPNEFEPLVVPTPYEFDRHTFLALRDVGRWRNYCKTTIVKNK